MFAGFVVRNIRFCVKGENVRKLWVVRKAMKEYHADHPECEYCRRNEKVQTHHIVPVSVSPSEADDKKNMMSLCAKRCHLTLGHMGNFKTYNKNVLETVSAARRG